MLRIRVHRAGCSSGRAPAADAIARSISRPVATFLTSGRHLRADVGRPDALSPAIAPFIYCPSPKPYPLNRMSMTQSPHLPRRARSDSRVRRPRTHVSGYFDKREIKLNTDTGFHYRKPIIR